MFKKQLIMQDAPMMGKTEGLMQAPYRASDKKDPAMKKAVKGPVKGKKRGKAK